MAVREEKGEQFHFFKIMSVVVSAHTQIQISVWTVAAC